MSKIFDSHCHPQFPQYDADRDEMIKRNLEKGVFMIAAGASLETSKQAIELANKYNGIWATVGLHPDEIETSIKGQVLSIKEYEILLKKEKVVAIGEVGLDYYRTPELEKQEQQREVFKQFLDLAIQYDKPIVLHVRDSAKGSLGFVHRDMLSIIENWKLKIENSALRERPGVVHSFTGTMEEAQAYLKLGFMLAFNGIITFSKEFDELIKFLPMNKILIETDAPWLTPAPNRGKRNEPSGVIEVAQKIALLKNIPFEMVAQETFTNTQKLFKI